MIYEDEFWIEASKELHRAKAKFPKNANNCVALMEEVGELAQALLQMREGKITDWNKVVDEAIQVAAMAARIAVEGDSNLAEPR